MDRSCLVGRGTGLFQASRSPSRFTGVLPIPAAHGILVRLEQEFDHKLPLDVFLGAPTLTQLALAESPAGEDFHDLAPHDPFRARQLPSRGGECRPLAAPRTD